MSRKTKKSCNLAILQSCNNSDGFTLIEIIITTAIVAILAVVGAISLFGYRSRLDLSNAGKEIAITLREAQNRSISQESTSTQGGGSRWGIHFENLVTSTDYYDLFWGTAYSADSVASRAFLPTSVTFTNPPSGSSTDIIFAPLTGLATSTVITVAGNSAGSAVEDIIVSSNGKISSNLEEGLVGYWHFDEGSATTTYDASGYGNNGTLVNSPTWQPSSNCKAGGCLSFNGVNNHVDFPGVGSFKTISLWANIQQGSLLSSNRWSFYSDYYIFYSDGNIKFENNPQPRLTAAVDLNQWVHIVVICASGIKNTLYVNGVFASQQDSASSLDCSRLYLGFNHIGSDFFNGLIDEVRIYNRALTATEISNQYNALK